MAFNPCTPLPLQIIIPWYFMIYTLFTVILQHIFMMQPFLFNVVIYNSSICNNSHHARLSLVQQAADRDLRGSSYLSRCPRLVLRTAIHCNCLVHVLIHLKQTKKDRCYNYVSHGCKVKSPLCIWARAVHFHSQITVFLHSWLYRHILH